MKLQVAAFLSFLIMPYALAEDQGGIKKKTWHRRRLMLLRMVIAVRMMQKK